MPNNPDTPSCPLIRNDAFISSPRPKGFAAMGLCCFLLAEQHMLNGKQQKPRSRGDICDDFKVSGL